MIITSSCIGMDSRRTYTSVSMDAYSRYKRVDTMSAKDFMDSMNSAFQDVHEDNKEKKYDKSTESEADTLSGNTENSLDYLKGKFNEISTSKLATKNKLEEDLKSTIRYMLLNFLLMLIIGKNGGGDMEDIMARVFGNKESSDGALDGFGQSIELYKVSEIESFEHYKGEYEETNFTAKGIVKTSDGRELDFNIDLTMSRSFEEYTKDQGVYETLRMKLVDPLIINYDTGAANISDQKFYFDLDTDGVMDEISMLNAGSGFLALDINEDGKINDGSELFGTKSGDGFKDLSRYDKDGNGWIDEADEIFDKLTILCFDKDGSMTQYKLKEKGVGAIYLGSKETEFDVRDQENRLDAKIRKTGIFMYENGGVGTIQHADLSVEMGA